MSSKKEQLAQAEKYLAGLQAAADVGQEIVAKLRGLLDEPAEPEAVKEWPQNGDVYWTVRPNGSVEDSEWGNDGSDHARAAIGNFHRTEALARRRVEALKVQAELRRMPGRCAYSPDEMLYCLQIHSNDGLKVRGASRWACAHVAIAGVWFDKRDAAEHALDTIGQDRLKLWLDDYLDTPIGGAQ